LQKLPEIFNRFKDDIEKEMQSIISSGSLPLYDMLRYHMGWIDEKGNSGDFGKGKFLRATLCILAYISTLKEGEEEKGSTVMPLAGSIELIHNFSLIHDDIQDNDIQRRHKPTLWYIWGKPQAINAGTTMKILANLAITRLENYGISCEKQLKVFRIINESCLKMLEGQYLDIEFEDKSEVSIDEYITMIERKTASLIEGAILIGAALNLEKDGLERLRKFGNLLGIAFQIRDDILGIWGSQDKTGKPHASDILKKKKSFPIVYTLNNAPEKMKKNLLKIYESKRINENQMLTVLGYLEDVEAKKFCEEKCRYYYKLAVNEIKSLPVLKKYLQSYYEISDFLLVRDF
jgi:geranylgeranyl diphosphate synthase type I